MRSLDIDENLFTDEGLINLADALKNNKNLNHLSFKSCDLVTN